MFQKTRIKLTAWYLLIIMLISISFSVVIYHGLNSELDRLERIERLRIQRRQPELVRTLPGLPTALFDPDVVAETRSRLIFFLIGINVCILGGSAIAGYFLAGRTLQPIADMMDEQNRFITDASHELRTPLTSLKSEIEVNVRNKNLQLNDAKKLLSSNLEEVNKLQQLSDGLIKLTQYQEGQNDMPIEKIHLTELSQEAIRKITAIAKNKKISVINTIPNLTIEGNTTLLTELLVIFLDNAIKYSGIGTKIRLSGKKVNDHAVLRIADQGIGIHNEDIPHLFNRFYRSDKSRTKTSVSGYGLGLSIAKQIVERHSGNVNVESKINEGTTFTVTIPVKHS